MRDPNRIYKFCNELARIWSTYCPDWRFGQLIYNIFLREDSDLFYFEEDKSIEVMKNFFHEDEDDGK